MLRAMRTQANLAEFVPLASMQGLHAAVTVPVRSEARTQPQGVKHAGEKGSSAPDPEQPGSRMS